MMPEESTPIMPPAAVEALRDLVRVPWPDAEALEAIRKAARSSEIPRRICLDRAIPAELAIRLAIAAVEDGPADPRLTDAVVWLSKALARVADFVDGVNPEPPA
jgi:hypothetical protein